MTRAMIAGPSSGYFANSTATSRRSRCGSGGIGRAASITAARVHRRRERETATVQIYLQSRIPGVRYAGGTQRGMDQTHNATTRNIIAWVALLFPWPGPQIPSILV